MARSIVFTGVIAIAVAFILSGGGIRGTAGPSSRLIAFQPVPEFNDDVCTWELAGSDASRLSWTPSFQASQVGSAGAVGSAVATRTPLRFVQDPYFEFSAVTVDHARNEVILMDAAHFNILVYDRTVTTPASAPMTTPKRRIGGVKTQSQYASDAYVDPKTGEIYAVNNDSLEGMNVFSREANGDVPPSRHLETPYGSYGMAVDEETQQLFTTVQHDGAILIWSKTAKEEERPIGIIQGDRTHMADPHDITFDPRTKLLYVVNFGTSRQAIAGTIGPNGAKDKPRVSNWPAGNLTYGYRHEVVLGTGTFGPPSVTVYRADARGNAAPVRVIEGPKTQLSWPTGIAVDPQNGEIYVANDTGNSITVYSPTAQGDAAPVRVLKGAKTLLKNPTGVYVDASNDEVWVASLGNHMATVYKRGASGDVAPLRAIRSAPPSAGATLINNPYSMAYDTTRDEILVPSCVQHPRIAAFARTADKDAVPVRSIEGQKTYLNRTVHGIAYDDIHDEMIVNQNIGQAVLVFRGAASGDEAPIRIIQGPKTQFSDPVSVAADPVHNEIFVFNMSGPVERKVLVFDRLAQGDVAPKRILKVSAGHGAIDPVHDLLIVGGGGGIHMYDRTAEGYAKPKATIAGPNSKARGARAIKLYPPTGAIVANINAAGGEDATEGAFTGVWNINDNGDVPPRWMIGRGTLRQIRGLAINAKEKTVMISDKYLNGVLTYSVPEVFDQRARPRETARAQ